MAESINLKGMVIRGFDKRSRSKNEQTENWFLAMLKNDDGDSITIRTDKKVLLKLIAGERVDVLISQPQEKLGELLEHKMGQPATPIHDSTGDVLEYKKGQWIPSTEAKDDKPKTNED